MLLLPCSHLEKMHNIKLKAEDHQIKSASDDQLRDLYMRPDVCDGSINLLWRTLPNLLAHCLDRITVHLVKF